MFKFSFPVFCLFIFLSCNSCTSSQNEYENSPETSGTQTIGVNSQEQLYLSQSSVCEKTESIKSAILKKVQVQECSKVTNEHLASITSLVVSNTNVYNTLKDTDFSGIANLETISLYNNRLRSLPPGIFDNLQKLKTLNLSNNQLTSLPPGIFNNLGALETLDLRDNAFPDTEKERIKTELQNKVNLEIKI